MDPAAAARIAKLDEVIRQVQHLYQNKDRLRHDVAGLLRVYHTLQPVVGTFRGEGQQVTLFYLYGVIPITYKGATYNIPVTIYFDAPYPRTAPRCFVTPTGTMAVAKNHPNVDQGGMVYAPFIAQWNERTSTLPELIGVLSSLFSAQPPVYATTQTGTDQRAQQATQQASETSGVIGAIGGLFGFGQPQAAQPTPQAAPMVVPAQPVQPVPVQPVRPSQPAVAAHVVAQPVAARPAGGAGSRKDLLVSQATQALRERWPFVLDPLVADANEQLERREQLRAEAKRVEEELAALRAEEQRQAAQAAELETLERELTEFVSANEGKEPNPDDLREALPPDGRQVLDLLAEELALEEFLVALDELLAARQVSIDDFLREVRDVSRRRFMCQVQRHKAEAAMRAAAGEQQPAVMATAVATPLPAGAPGAPFVAIARPVPDSGARRMLAVA